MPDDSRPEARMSHDDAGDVRLAKVLVRMIDIYDPDNQAYQGYTLSDAGEDGWHDEDGEDSNYGNLPSSSTRAPASSPRIKTVQELQAEAWAFVRQYTSHLNSCGFPHAWPHTKQFAEVDEFQPGAMNVLIGVPFVSADWEELDSTLENSITYLAQAKSERFRVLPEVIEDDQLANMISLAGIARWHSIDPNPVQPSSWRKNHTETREQWLSRVAARPALVSKLVDLWDTANEHMDLFASMIPRDDQARHAEQVTFLLDDLIPMGVVTLLAGASETGKTTILAELAVATAMSEYGTSWLGRQVNRETSSGAVIYLSAEDDNPAFMRARRDLIEPQRRDGRFIDICGDHRAIEEILADLSRYKRLSLLIVDPAREYLRGGESDSAAVSTLFSALQQFASQTGCAVVLVHHLSKGAAPASLTGLKAAIRGTQVWIDRPRQILGMFKRGGTTIVGTCKNSAPPPSKGMPETAFRREEGTLRYVPVEIATAQPSAAMPAVAEAAPELDRVQEAVLGLIRRFNARGRLVRRTGANGVYEARGEAAELADVSKRAMWAAVDRLLKQGAVSDNRDAGLTADFQAGNDVLETVETDGEQSD